MLRARAAFLANQTTNHLWDEVRKNINEYLFRTIRIIKKHHLICQNRLGTNTRTTDR